VSGRTSYLAGLSAEDQVAKLYRRAGFDILETRWRGKGGEIDLIAKGAIGVVFIEVKKARDAETAASKLSQRQIERIRGAASEYLGRQPDGQNTDARFDVALVDGQGTINVIENVGV
jgi:putative endonuclease